MHSKATKATIFILMLVQLYSCRGFIPITGEDIPMDTAEDPGVPASIPAGQSSPEATVSSLPTILPETPACQTAVASVKANNAYLREGPDLRFEANTQYKTGDQFTVLGRYKDWFHVQSSDGKKGWLYKDWLTILPSIDTGNICSISERELPPTPQNFQKPEKDKEDCVPTYYDSCN